jgi:hypothetical protein
MTDSRYQGANSGRRSAIRKRHVELALQTKVGSRRGDRREILRFAQNDELFLR